MNPSKMENDGDEVSSTRVKLPEFYRPNPHTWSVQAEMQFTLNRITGDERKFLLAASTLPSDVCESVLDIIESPPPDDKYGALKKALMERHSVSQEKRLEELLDKKEIGDSKPSEVFRTMKRLAGDSFNDVIIRKLWLRLLPKVIQVALISSEDKNTTELISMADRMFEAAEHPKVFVMDSPSTSGIQQQQPSEVAELKQQIAQLQKFVARLTTQRSRSRSPRRYSNYNRPRSSSRSPLRKFDFCWYHHKYGSRAQKCIKPCLYVGPNKVSTPNTLNS